MRRRALAALPVALVACRTASVPRGAAVGTSPRALALSIADLPGFTLREELAHTPSTPGGDDPYGRLGSYSATFGLMQDPSGAQVISSINTYVSPESARAAFGAWRSAVPSQYRHTTLSVGLDERDAVAYLRDGDGTILIGYCVRNVLGSLRAPAADAERLVRLALSRT